MIKPVLAQFAVGREEDIPLEGYYDSALSLWVSPSGMPLVAASKQLLELRTKSQGGRESGDDIERPPLLELLTKTKTQRESDDDGRCSLLELMTKTGAVRECDGQ